MVNVLREPRYVIVLVGELYDTSGVRVQIFLFPEALGRDGEVELLLSLVVDELRVSDANETVVAVDLEGALLVASEEVVDDPLSPTV